MSCLQEVNTKSNGAESLKIKGKKIICQANVNKKENRSNNIKMTKYNSRGKALRMKKESCITLIKHLPRKWKNHKQFTIFIMVLKYK